MIVRRHRSLVSRPVTWRTVVHADLPVLPELRMELPAPEVDEPLTAAALLADRTRAGILAMLRDGPHCVCEMAAALGERQNNVSNHLARLRDAGLVRASRQGVDTRRVYYERDEAACARAAGALRDLLEPSS
jgi:DNA-binding transcriptional ArsR family regulator